jgi:hypothetical protein
MNGLEFARCLTAGGLGLVLAHAAPAQMSVEVRTRALIATLISMGVGAVIVVPSLAWLYTLFQRAPSRTTRVPS